jgi:hypothetical protein
MDTWTDTKRGRIGEKMEKEREAGRQAGKSSYM